MSTSRPKSFSVNLKLDLQFQPKFTRQKCLFTLKNSTSTRPPKVEELNLQNVFALKYHVQNIESFTKTLVLS